ncbi:MAG: GFA family protein [Caulobacteraceae bacterium]
MKLTGGCLCGAVRFEAGGEVRMRGLCLCKTCQKVSGGAGNLFIGLMAENFRYTQGEPRRFAMSAEAPAREFCETCGVQIAARSPRAPDGVIVKVGALDEPAMFEGPALVVWTEEKEAFHHVPEGVAAFARVPGR